jgi:glycosyltransferase involved in cell wall biosynthesis
MAPGDGALVKWSRAFGVPTYRLPVGMYTNGRKTVRDFARFGIDVPRMTLAVRRVAVQEKAELVYVNGPRVLPAAARLTQPVVFHAHSFVRGWHERQLMRWSLRSAQATVIAASQFVAAQHDSATVIYNGVADLMDTRREPRIFPRTTARVGFIGRIAREKGLLDFVRAARRLSESGADAEFLIYGETLFGDAAYERQVRAIAEGAPVTFRGWTDDLARAYADLEMLVVPSGPGEAATRVIMEAFSAGTPVVAYPSGGIPELVEHGRTGLLTNAADSQSLARSVAFLSQERGQMERLSAAGREEWTRRFRVERFRRSVCDLLEKCARISSETRRAAWAPERGHDETHASR